MRSIAWRVLCGVLFLGSTLLLAEYPPSPTLTVATVINPTTVELAWSDPAPSTSYPDEEGGFYIYYGYPGDEYEEYTYVKEVGTNTLTTRITGLPSNTRLNFFVTAYDYYSYYESFPSNIKSVDMPPGIPSAPISLTASITQQNGVYLSWVDGGDWSNPADGYAIYRRKAGDSQHFFVDWTYSDDYVDNSIEAGYTYEYYVLAYNETDYSRPSQSVQIAVPETFPNAPTGLSFPVITPNSISLKWNDRSKVENGFVIERSVDGVNWGYIGDVGTNQTTFTDGKVIQNTIYYYRVYAYNDIGGSDYAYGRSRTKILEIADLEGIAFAVVAGTGPSQVNKEEIPVVAVYDATDGEMVFQKVLFPTTGTSVRAALGDVNNDGTLDVVVGSGEGIEGQILIFDGGSGKTLYHFKPFGDFTGGVYVASADINGDNYADLIVGAGDKGGPRVTLYSGENGEVLRDFMAYEEEFRGGVLVGSGDVNGDGTPDVIVGTGPGGGPRVKVFDGKEVFKKNAEPKTLMDFFAFDSKLRAGVRVAGGDVDGDGKADIIAGAGTDGAPHVKVLKGMDGNNPKELASFYAYDSQFRGGVSVGFTKPYGVPMIITGPGVGGGPHLKFISNDSTTELFVVPNFFRGGLFVGGF